MQINYKNPGGEGQYFVLNQTLSPMQQLTDRILSNRQYPWNSSTRFRFNSINASATVTLRLSVLNKFAAIRIIGDNSAVKGYGAPSLVGINQGVNMLG